MRIRYLPVIGAATLGLPVLPGHTGPCSHEIDRMQVQLDAKIAMIVDTARFAHEARAAFGLPARTKLSVAEGARGDGAWIGEAVAAMTRARDADGTSDVVACEQSLEEVRRTIGQ
jgi:hypothetical protein